MVNLLLFGRAVSNVFDGDRDLSEGSDRIVLHGTPSKAPVGLLTLYEHFHSLEVCVCVQPPLS